MGAADDLKKSIFSWVEAVSTSVNNLDKLASELEEREIKDDVGVRGLGGVVGGVVGVRLTDIKGAKKKVQQLEDLENREKKIQTLIESLAEEGKEREQPDYVVDQILRVMAKEHNLELNDQINVHELLCKFSGKEFFMLKTFVDQQQKLKPVHELISVSGRNEASEEEPVGSEVGGRAAGLLFTVSGLTDKLRNVDNDDSHTETADSLREGAKAMMTTGRKLHEEVEEIKGAFEKLAVVKRCIKKNKRFDIDMEKLLSLVKHVCDDETLQWLSNNSKSESKTFLKLVDLFHLLKETIYEETKKNHSNHIDITFVAHGSIQQPVIPAGRLLPLPTIADVVLHCPWNCLLSSDAAYGVATGLMKPEDTRFCCINEKCCLPTKNHCPKELQQWNSMRKAKEKEESVPNIMVSPVKRQTDGAWKQFQILKTEHGGPETNRFVILYTVQGKVKPSDRVPFCAVTLALSLVLFFSRFTANVHLAACLGDRSQEELDKTDLDRQYAWANDNTGMTCRENLFPEKDTRLYRVMEAVFGCPFTK